MWTVLEVTFSGRRYFVKYTGHVVGENGDEDDGLQPFHWASTPACILRHTCLINEQFSLLFFDVIATF